MPPNIATIPNLPTLEEVRTEKARRSLRSFVEQAWPIVEPGAVFTPGWHIDCICEHLEAVTNGDISELLINMPPRHMKSTSVSVFWPVWEWINDPTVRWVFNSYSDTLSIRDSVKCRHIIQHEWYRKRWGHVYKLTSDQNVKSRYENDKTGYRIATSVTGGNTGEGGNRIVCLDYDTTIVTSIGDLQIGAIVDNKIRCMVLSIDPLTGRHNWNNIEAFEKNDGRESYRVTFSDGRFIEGTSDHHVYVINQGTRPLSGLSPGERVATHDEALHNLWEGSSAFASPHETHSRTNILQPHMPRSMAIGTEQPPMGRGSTLSYLQSVWHRISCQDQQIRDIAALLKDLSNRLQSRSPQALLRHMLTLWREYRDQIPQSREKKFLLASLLEYCTSRLYQWHQQSEVPAWALDGGLPGGFSPYSDLHSRTRQQSMSIVPPNTGAKLHQHGRSPYRLRKESQRPRQSNLSLSLVPRINARHTTTTIDLPGTYVASVERIPTPRYVYNIRVANDHNYFANGILVHNCDDPLNVIDADSEIKRAEVLRWWFEVMPTRINDWFLGRKVIVMQRAHHQDLSGAILDRSDMHHLCLPAEWEPRVQITMGSGRRNIPQPHDDCPIHPDPRTQPGELLWPNKWPKEAIESWKSQLGPYSSVGQLQQRPTPREGVLFKVSMFRPLPTDFDTPDSDGHTMRSSLTVGTAVDLAWSEKESADNTASVTGGIDKSGNIYLLNAWRVKADEVKLATELAHHLNATNPSIAGIEQSSYTKTATVDLIRRINTLLIRGIPILAVPVKGDKYTRAQLPAGRGQVGMLYADTSAPWWPAFLSELLDFPKGAHDDWVDALSLLVQLLVEKVGIKPLPPNSEYGFNEATVQRKSNWVSRAIASQEVKIIRRGRSNDDATTTRDDTEGR